MSLNTSHQKVFQSAFNFWHVERVAGEREKYEIKPNLLQI
jgi:hypothetical protein